MKSETIIQSPFAGLTSVLAGSVSWFLTGAAKVGKTMQVGQMCSALSQLSDEQLDDLGITRQGIPAHAMKLMEM